MKNIVLAAALALIAVPALAVGPESFSVDVSRGYAVTAPGQSSSQAQQERSSNWAPRGQQAQDQATSSEEGTTSSQPRAMKASGKPRHHRSNAGQAPQSGNQAGHAPATGASHTAPASGSAPAGQR